MKNFIKGFFESFTLKEILAVIGLGVCGAIVCNENYEHGLKDGYKEGVQDCINITKEVIEESKAKDVAE
jgi:hypothetical protein